jgi:hypothetical protein
MISLSPYPVSGQRPIAKPTANAYLLKKKVQDPLRPCPGNQSTTPRNTCIVPSNPPPPLFFFLCVFTLFPVFFFFLPFRPVVCQLSKAAASLQHRIPSPSLQPAVSVAPRVNRRRDQRALEQIMRLSRTKTGCRSRSAESRQLAQCEKCPNTQQISVERRTFSFQALHLRAPTAPMPMSCKETPLLQRCVSSKPTQ